MTPALDIRSVSYRYGRSDRWALRDVSLTVDRGEVLAVVGPSGSGKTTLLRLLSGLLDPVEGEVHLGGQPSAGLPPERRPVAMVFQGFALFPHLTVRGNVAFGMRVRREPKADIASRVRAAAEQLAIDDLLDR